MTIGQKITSTLVPPRCVLCGGPGQRGDELWGLDLCRYCEVASPPCPVPAPPARAVPPPGVDALLALFLYEDPVDRLVTGLKFRGDLSCARVMGMLLARRLASAGSRLPQVLVPMPLHWTRYRERGFNQAEAVAGQVGRRIGVPLETGLLRRVRATAPQTTLSATERRRNLDGAFAVPPGVRVPARIALLDDVVTTGSTAGAAAGALREAGARHVELWACAVAQRQGW